MRRFRQKRRAEAQAKRKAAREQQLRLDQRTKICQDSSSSSCESLLSSHTVSLEDSSSSEPELDEIVGDLISSSDDEVKKETGASSRRLPKNKTGRVRAAEFFDFLSKFPIVALERCPSHLPVQK
jgi:hypothetical protein